MIKHISDSGFNLRKIYEPTIITTNNAGRSELATPCSNLLTTISNQVYEFVDKNEMDKVEPQIDCICEETVELRRELMKGYKNYTRTLEEAADVIITLLIYFEQFAAQEDLWNEINRKMNVNLKKNKEKI